MLWPGMLLRVGCCDLRHFIARNPDQAEFHLPPTPVRPAKDVELAWTSAVMTILHHNSKGFLSAKPRRIGFGEVVDEFAESDLAGAALDDLGGDRVGLEDPLGRKQHPAALRLVVDEPNAARQPWARVGGDDRTGIVQPLLPSPGSKAPGGICFGAT
jgi:hypothetical protein